MPFDKAHALTYISVPHSLSKSNRYTNLAKKTKNKLLKMRYKLACVRALVPAFFQESINVGDMRKMVAAIVLLFNTDATATQPQLVTVSEFIKHKQWQSE